jgi:probable phosphoglycerate mutase
METAEPLAAQTGLTVRLEPRVQEYDFGVELSGLTWQEIRDRQPEIVEALRGGGPDFPRYPGEEGRETFRERVCSAVWEIAARHEADGAVAVVTHGGPIAVFVMEALGRPYRHPNPFAIDNASLTTLEITSQGPHGSPRAVVVGLNDTCYLGAEDGRLP